MKFTPVISSNNPSLESASGANFVMPAFTTARPRARLFRGWSGMLGQGPPRARLLWSRQRCPRRFPLRLSQLLPRCAPMIITRAPCAMNSWAVAKSMPLLTPVITAILVFNVIAIRNRILPKQLCDHSGVEVGPDFRNNLVAKSHDPTITMVESHTILRSS